MANQAQIQQPVLTQNPQAVVSLVSSLLGIFFPLFTMFISASLSNDPIMDHFFWYIGVLSLVPSIIGIVFGHIGRYQAKNNVLIRNTLETATTGLILGYIFGSLYFTFMLCTLSVLSLMITH